MLALSDASAMVPDQYMEHIINTEISTELICRLALCERTWSKIETAAERRVIPSGHSLTDCLLLPL
jgi:hypothetical protein